MLVYEKKVNDERKLFGTMANVPAENDVQLTYKDGTGTVITPVAGDSYVDGGSANKVQRIARKSDNKAVNVFIGDKCIIGEAVTQVVAEAPKAEVKKEVKFEKAVKFEDEKIEDTAEEDETEEIEEI